MNHVQRVGREQAWREPGGEAVEDGAAKAAVLEPHVDVTGVEPERPHVRAEVKHYAVPSAERYPLDSYTQVQKAASYFDDWRRQMPAEFRREYAVNLVKRASALGIAVSDNASRDGAEGRAPERAFETGIDSRREFLGVEQNLVLDKLAAVAERAEPDLVRASLSELDRHWGLVDHYGDRVVDPYRTVFAPALPEKTASGELDARTVGRLTELADGVVTEKFGSAFAEKFRQSPDDAARALSPEQRTALALLATPENEGR